MGKNYKTIAIPKKLFKCLNQLANNSGFENTEEFVEFVLEEVVNNEQDNNNELTNEEKDEINIGLKELGYKS